MRQVNRQAGAIHNRPGQHSRDNSGLDGNYNLGVSNAKNLSLEMKEQENLAWTLKTAVLGLKAEIAAT